MDWRLITAGLLALCWGFGLALFLQCHPDGRWLALRRTYVAVIIGVGVDLLILSILLPLSLLLQVILVISLSSLGLIYRSLHNERAEESD